MFTWVEADGRMVTYGSSAAITSSGTPSQADTRIESPYNSYQRMGLPPTPIAGPGADAMRAAVNPAAGDWLYFVTVKPGDTRFTADYAEHQRNVAEADALRKAGSASPSAAR